MRSFSEDYGSLHTAGEVLSWITDAKTENTVRTTLVPLRDTERWHRSDDAIAHESGLFFEIVAVDVRAGNREVGGWTSR